MSQSNNQDTIKTVGVVALSVIIFAVLYNLLLGGRNGFGFEMGYNSGFGLNASKGSILGLAVQLLWITFIISLVIGGATFVRKYAEENKIHLYFLNLTNNDFAKDTCANCGKELQPGWKCCPSCGSEKLQPLKDRS
jgi:hypothetical protein